MTHYLLEKTRVVRQSSSEYSYHIFYLLLRHLDRFAVDATLCTSEQVQWNYLPNWTSYANEKVDEVEELLNALQTMNVMDANVFSLLLIILHLGNVLFVDTNEGSAILDSCHAQCVSRFLCVENLNQLLCYKMIQSSNRTSVYYVGLSVAQAESGRDALAKDLYSMLFTYLMRRCNNSIHVTGKTEVTRYVGILDIFGFEQYDSINNKFDQFCINYCNEKLHQVFIHNIFSAERRLIESEGGDGSNITYSDNINCLQLIDGENGLIKLIDEMCILGRSDDGLMLSSFQKQHARHSCFKALRNQFQIVHFAATVTYNVEGFIISNTDRLSPELESYLVNSKSPFIADLYAHRSKTSASPRKKQANHTIVAKFNQNLKALIEELQSTQIQFIRCIKPNNQQIACQFHRPLVYQQLKYSGIMDIIHVRKASYPLRQNWQELRSILLELNLFYNMGVRRNSCDSIEHIKSIFREALTSVDWFEGQLSALVYMKHDIFYKLQCYKSVYNASVIYQYWNSHRIRMNTRLLACRIRLLRSSLYRFSRHVRFLNQHRKTFSAFKKLLRYFYSWRRRMLLKKQASADMVVMFLRRYQIRCAISHLKHMQSRISAMYRGRYQRGNYCALRKAAICLQRYARGFLSYTYWHPIVENIIYKKLMDKNRKALWRMYCTFRNYYWRKCTQEILRAVRWGEVDGLRHLLQKFHYSTIISVHEIINMRDAQGGYASLLHLAVAGGHVEIVEWLLHMGCDPLQTDIIGQSPLHRLPVSNVKPANAKVLGILLLHCPKTLYEADRQDTHRLHLDKYQKEPFASMIIKGEKLTDIIDTAMKLRHRSASKAKHKEALRRGSTVALELLPEAVQGKIMESWHMEHSPQPEVVSKPLNQEHSTEEEVYKRSHTSSFVAALHTAHDLATDPKLHRRHGSFTLTPATLPLNSSPKPFPKQEESSHIFSNSSTREAQDTRDTVHEVAHLPSSASKVLFQQHVSKTLKQLQNILNEQMTPVQEWKEQSTSTTPASCHRGFPMTNSRYKDDEDTSYVEHVCSPAKRRASTIQPSSALQHSWPRTSDIESNKFCEDTHIPRSRCGSLHSLSANNTIKGEDTDSSGPMRISSSKPFGSSLERKAPTPNDKSLLLSDMKSDPRNSVTRRYWPNDTSSHHGISTEKSSGRSSITSSVRRGANSSNSKGKFQASEYCKLQEPTYSRYDAIMQHIGGEKTKSSSQKSSKQESKRQYELYVAKQQNVSKDPVLNFLVHREAIAKKK